MAIVEAPALRVTAFSKWPEHVGQVAVRHRVSGAVSTVSRGPYQWSGRINWRPRDEAELKALSIMAVQLAGQVNQLKIPLPRRYAPRNPVPDGVTLQATGMVLQGAESVLATVAVTGGDWLASPGDHLNIGGRLYLVIGHNAAGEYLLEPNHVPDVFPQPVEASAPYVLGVAVQPGQLEERLEGWRILGVQFNWLEYPGNT